MSRCGFKSKLCKMFNFIVIAALFSCALGSTPLDATGIDKIIAGGQPVRIKDYPYQVALLVTNADFTGGICGGSIISKDFIVTAAHCTYNRKAADLKIRAGSSFRMVGGRVRKIAEIREHPNYDHATGTFDYDIAILKLSRSLRFGRTVKAIHLPGLNQIMPVGTKCVVTGWGRLEKDDPFKPIKLRVVELPLVSDKECQRAYKPTTITPRMICAGHKEAMQEPWKGDSGGPLVANGILVGVVSYVSEGLSQNVPGVYARVANLRDFINGATGL